MDFTDVIKGVQNEFKKSINTEKSILLLDWTNLHTVEDIGQPMKAIFKLQGDSVLLNLEAKIDICSKYIEHELINLAQRLALTCVEGLSKTDEDDIPIKYTLVELGAVGNLFDKDLQKLNQFTYVGDHIDYGIQLLKGFYDIEKTLDSLTIEKHDDIMEIHIDLYMAINFDVKKLM